MKGSLLSRQVLWAFLQALIFAILVWPICGLTKLIDNAMITTRQPNKKLAYPKTENKSERGGGGFKQATWKVQTDLRLHFFFSVKHLVGTTGYQAKLVMLVCPFSGEWSRR